MKKLDWLICFILIAAFSVVCFYRLGWLSLQSYDEAWYAVIARNILIRNNPLLLWFNGAPFTDHPALGYWIMAIVYHLGGISEFSTRVPSAVMGVGSLVLTYLIGKELIHRRVGLMASLMLGSSLWFVYRARSGNLDIPLLFFYLLTVLLGLLYQKNRRVAVLVGLSFGCLLLVKTIIGVSAGLVLLYLLVSSKYSKKLKVRDALLVSFVCILTILPWYGYNTVADRRFLFHHFLEVGLRAGNPDFVSQGVQIQKVLLYLHSGVGKWYTLSLVGFLALIVFFAKHKRTIILLVIWILVVGGPFLVSEKTEVWHLIPLYPPLFLSAALSFDCLAKWSSQLFSNLMLKKILALLPLGLVIFLASYQLRQIWRIVIPLDRYMPLVDQIAQKAGALPGKLYLKDGVGPEVIWYSGKNIVSFGINPEAFAIMKKILENSQEKVLIIVPLNDLPTLDNQQVDYTVVEKNSDYALIANDSVYRPESQ